LYVKQKGRLRLAGFFNVKLDKAKRLWLPCEVEALGIASALHHYAPFLIQAESRAFVVTDSKACVQAVGRLERGQFSMSARVSTFLAAVSRYQVSILHAPGVAILPSDYSSRNPVECDVESCQVCRFVSEPSTAVVRNLTVQDVVAGRQRLPFTNRPAWRALQQECQHLRRVFAYLKQGTRLSKKDTSSGEVKRYLQKVSVARDGVLVVGGSMPLKGGFKRIVVPRNLVNGVLNTMHLQLSYPSAFQMKKAVGRVCRQVLAAAVSLLNTRVRFSGRSARELWTQRDQFTLSPILVNDRSLINEQQVICC
jgi:hypothetical protein